MEVTERDDHDIVLVDGLVEALDVADPYVRPAMVAAARARIAGGDHPAAYVLAGSVVAHFT
jgi:hypothetical protein